MISVEIVGRGGKKANMIKICMEFKEVGKDTRESFFRSFFGGSGVNS